MAVFRRPSSNCSSRRRSRSSTRARKPNSPAATSRGAISLTDADLAARTPEAVRAIDVLKKSKLPIVDMRMPGRAHEPARRGGASRRGLPDARALTGRWAEWFNGGNPVEPPGKCASRPNTSVRPQRELQRRQGTVPRPADVDPLRTWPCSRRRASSSRTTRTRSELRSTRFPSLMSGARRMTAGSKTCSSISPVDCRRLRRRRGRRLHQRNAATTST